MFATIARTLALTSLLYLASATLLAGAASARINPEEIVSAHNQWRQRVGSPPIRWSDQLAGVAQAWADQLAREGRMRHSTAPYGENIYAISGRQATGRDAVDAWASEIKFFKNGIFPNVSTTGHWAAVGHYTQVVWHSTTQVGCGAAGSASFEVWVCNYDPRGNTMGRNPLAQDASAATPNPGQQLAGAAPAPLTSSASPNLAQRTCARKPGEQPVNLTIGNATGKAFTVFSINEQCQEVATGKDIPPGEMSQFASHKDAVLRVREAGTKRLLGEFKANPAKPEMLVQTDMDNSNPRVIYVNP